MMAETRRGEFGLGGEFPDAHGDACVSVCMTLATALAFMMCLLAGALADWRHVVFGVGGYGLLLMAGFIGARRRPGWRAHPPYIDCRAAFVLAGVAAAVWQGPALLEAAPGALVTLLCFGGVVDGVMLGVIAARSKCSFMGAVKAAWKEGTGKSEGRDG